MKKPRDLGLLLWALLHRVPVAAPITEEWIDIARQHCGMSAERLAELRTEVYAGYWARMEQKRASRLAYFRTHGEVPQGWTPPAAGEQDRTRQVMAMKLYWHTRARIKARLRKRPRAVSAKLMNAYMAMQQIRSKPRRRAALAVVESMLYDSLAGGFERLSFQDYRSLQALSAARHAEFERLSRGRKILRRDAV